MTTTIELFKDKAGKWRFHIIAANGEKTAQSQAYSTKTNAKRGAKREVEGRKSAKLVVPKGA